MILAIDVMTETRVLEGVFSFGGMDVDLGRSVETDGLSLDNFGVVGGGNELIGGMELERSQFTTF